MKLNEIKVSLEQVAGLKNYYNHGMGLPDPPNGYRYQAVVGNWGEIKAIKECKKYLNNSGEAVDTWKLEDWDGAGRYYVILPEKIPVKYRFICDDPTPRLPKVGDWVPYWGISKFDKGGQYEYRANRFIQVSDSYMEDCGNDPTLIHRREEIVDGD